MSDVTELARALVEIPSHEDETAVGEYIAEWLREHTDASVTHDESGVIARRSPDDGDPDRLALVGHHDVVPPDDPQLDGEEYVVEERDGRLYGRGSADMKGSVAAAMCAFRDAASACTFASFRGEEVGGVGARHAIEEGFAPERAIVGEGSTSYSAPGVTDVVVAHRGRRASTLVASGVSAHASEPEAGENAIYRALDAVSLVRDATVPNATVLGHHVEGSIVVTEIDGGDTWNVIPDRCEVTIDERTVPGGYADLAACETVDGVEWLVEQDLPPMACDDPEFADAVLAAARAVQARNGTDEGPGDDTDEGLQPESQPQHVTKPHATDAGWLAEAGTSCVICGAAEPGEAHTKDESVSLAVLDRCYEVYLDAVERTATR